MTTEAASLCSCAQDAEQFGLMMNVLLRCAGLTCKRVSRCSKRLGQLDWHQQQIDTSSLIQQQQQQQQQQTHMDVFKEQKEACVLTGASL